MFPGIVETYVSSAQLTRPFGGGSVLSVVGGYCHLGRAGQGSLGSCGFRQIGSLSNLGGLPCFGVCGDLLMTVFVDGKPVGFEGGPVGIEGGLLGLEWGCKGEGDLRVCYICSRICSRILVCNAARQLRTLALC